MTKIYYDDDANLDVLKGKKIAIIGFGSQGHAHALNLRDSGLDVVVAEVEGSGRWTEAEEKGFSVTSASEAAKVADVVMMLVPDTMQKKIYEESIKEGLESGNALFFAHGFNIHFKQIIPEPEIDVIMVAPKGPGHIVRRMYEEGIGVPALLAVEQDATGQAEEVGLAYAKALGSTKAGLIETTFKEETETDLFGEQCVLCGGVSELIKAGFDALVEAGYQPEIAYFECLHELKLIVDLIYENGISGMRYSISDTAEYGDMTRGKRIISPAVRDEMKKILSEIQSGEFAKEWIAENEAGCPNFNRMREEESKHLVEEVGKKLRAMMPWITGK